MFNPSYELELLMIEYFESTQNNQRKEKKRKIEARAKKSIGYQKTGIIQRDTKNIGSNTKYTKNQNGEWNVELDDEIPEYQGYRKIRTAKINEELPIPKNKVPKGDHDEFGIAQKSDGPKVGTIIRGRRSQPKGLQSRQIDKNKTFQLQDRLGHSSDTDRDIFPDPDVHNKMISIHKNYIQKPGSNVTMGHEYGHIVNRTDDNGKPIKNPDNFKSEQNDFKSKFNKTTEKIPVPFNKRTDRDNRDEAFADNYVHTNSPEQDTPEQHEKYHNTTVKPIIIDQYEKELAEKKKQINELKHSNNKENLEYIEELEYQIAKIKEKISKEIEKHKKLNFNRKEFSKEMMR